MFQTASLLMTEFYEWKIEQQIQMNVSHLAEKTHQHWAETLATSSMVSFCHRLRLYSAKSVKNFI